MKKLFEEIKDLHKLHSVTKDFNHFIEYQPGSWKMFEPSKFIYSFFSFNTFYSFNWSESVAKGELISYSMDDELTESKKFKNMVDFIFNHFEDSYSIEFVNTILNSKSREDPISRRMKLIRSLDKITVDDRITESEKEDFIREFSKLLETNKLLKGKLKNDILRFVYLVRNNIFHGTKTTIDMTDQDQRYRLDIYSNILIATNDMLFKSLEHALDFRLDNKYHFRI